MENTGQTFRYFRTQKALSIKEVADGIVTPQFLNKYERGESDIRFSNLIQLLTRMNVTMSEFIEKHEVSYDRWLEQTEKEIDTICNSFDSFKLKVLIDSNQAKYEETNERRYLFLSIIAKNSYNRTFTPIFKIDFAVIKEYLGKVEHWGKFELFLIAYTKNLLPTEEAFYYCHFLLRMESDHNDFNRSRYDTALQIIHYLIRIDELERAKKLLYIYFEFPKADRRTYHMHQDLFSKHLYGLWLIKSGDPKGEDLCNKVIEIYSDLLPYHSYANHCNIVLQQFIVAARSKERTEAPHDPTNHQ